MEYRNCHLIQHPLMEMKLARLRNRETPTCEIRRAVSELGAIIGYEATHDLHVRETTVTTPLAEEAKVKVLDDTIALLPLIRGGLGMVEGMLRVTRTAEVYHIGVRLDPVTKSWVAYYAKLPSNMSDYFVLILEPCIATGARVSLAIDFCKNHGAKRVKCVSILGAPEGIKNLCEAHPDVEVYLAAIDDHVDENGLIVPGMGVPGDRIVGIPPSPLC